MTFTADVLVLLLGLACATHAAGRSWLIAFGVLLQAQIAVRHPLMLVRHPLMLQVGVRELESAGVPFAVGFVVPSFGWWLSDQLARLPQVVHSAILGSLLVMLAYSSALTALFTCRTVHRIVSRAAHMQPRRRSASSSQLLGPTALSRRKST